MFTDDRVSCCQCTDFKPDTVGFGDGIGECSSYEKGKANNPIASDLYKAFKARGGSVFYPKRLRYCRVFKQL